LDYIIENTVNCPRCNAPLGQQYQQPPQQYQQPQLSQQYQQGPEPQYQQYPEQQYQQPQQQYAPPQGGYDQQPPLPPKRKTPTVRRIDLTDTIIVVSLIMLLAEGFNNLSTFSGAKMVGPVVLGFIAIVISLIGMLMLVMPSMMKDVAPYFDMFLLISGLVLFFWGLAATFGNDFGWSGGMVTASGLGLLAAAGLKMGILK